MSGNCPILSDKRKQKSYPCVYSTVDQYYNFDLSTKYSVNSSSLIDF